MHTLHEVFILKIDPKRIGLHQSNWKMGSGQTAALLKLAGWNHSRQRIYKNSFFLISAIKPQYGWSVPEQSSNPCRVQISSIRLPFSSLTGIIKTAKFMSKIGTGFLGSCKGSVHCKIQHRIYTDVVTTPSSYDSKPFSVFWLCSIHTFSWRQSWKKCS